MKDFLLRKLAFKKLPSKKAMFLSLSLSIFFCLFLAGTAKAEPLDISSIGDGLVKGASTIALGMAELCIRLAVFFLQFFVQLAGWNNYIDVPIVMLGWTMVRDVANMFFVVIFLVIAIGTILGLEQYQWNKTLVKLVLAAVFINFSNLICGLFIDVAHVFTITFVNAISATAGGNLINMFKLDQIFKLTSDATTPTAAAGAVGTGENPNLTIRLLAASVAAFLFAGLSLITIAVYTIVLLYRVIILWVLIILSPIAYVASVLPQSQSYAKEWWDEFSRYVLVAPLMVFFLWLAFATMGAGNVATDATSGMGLQMVMKPGEGYTAEQFAGSSKDAASLAAITEWANLANLLIPICLLWVGMERVSKMGVRGGDIVSSGMNLFKSAATMATGYAAGRWMVKKGWDTGKKGVALAGKGLGKAAWYGVHGENAKNWMKWNVSAFKAWRNDTGVKPVVEEVDEEKAVVDAKTGQAKKDEKGKVVMEKTGKKVLRIKTKADGTPEMEESNVRFGAVQRFFHKRAAADAFSAKKAKRMEDFAKTREDLLKSRTSANPSHPMFMTKAERKTEDFDIARFELGALEAEKARSEDKTKRYSAMGKKATGAHQRFKITSESYGWLKWLGPVAPTHLKYGLEKGHYEGKSITEQRAEHAIEAEKYEALSEEGTKRGRSKYAKTERGKQTLEYTESAKLRTESEKQAEETSRLTAAIASLGKVEKETGKSILDRLAANKAMTETLKETFSGRQDKRTFEEQKVLKEKADKEIKDAETADTDLQKLKADKDSKGADLSKLDEEIKKLEAAEAGLGRSIAGLPSNFRAVIQGFEAAARQSAEQNVKPGDGESAKDFEEKKQRYSQELLKESLEGYVTDPKNNIQAVEPEVLLKLGTEIEDKEKQIAIKKLERKNVLEEHGGIKDKLSSRRMEVLDSLGTQGKIPAWDAARAQSEREMHSRYYRTARSDMMNNTAQTYIWDEKGIETPNTAYQEFGDSLQKDFADMNYEATNANSESFRQKMVAKRNRGEDISLEDRAIGEALMMKQHGGAWIDDQILDMHNEDAKEWSAALYGGKDSIENRKKILDTVKRHRVGSAGKVAGEREMDDLSNVFNSLLGEQATALLEAFRPGNEGSAVKDITNALNKEKVNISKLDPNLLRSAAGADVADSDEAVGLLVKRLSNFDEYTRRMILNRLGKNKT